MHAGIPTWLCTLSLLVATAGYPIAAAPQDDATLVRLLRQGGYQIYFRHAATDWSMQESGGAAADPASCDPRRMRQLSAAGRETARAVGRAIRALGIPIGRVLVSPYCRTIETARLMDLGTVESTLAVVNLRVAELYGGRAAIVASARALLSQPPAAGSNTVVVAHGNVARAATNVYPDEGEGLIFRPGGEAGFTFVGRLTPGQWSAQAAAAEPR